MEFEERMKRMEEQYDKDHNIFCPFCGTKADEEEMSGHTSYHGDGDDKSMNCSECQKEFWVKEIVDRTFETRKQEDGE